MSIVALKENEAGNNEDNNYCYHAALIIMSMKLEIVLAWTKSENKRKMA